MCVHLDHVLVRGAPVAGSMALPVVALLHLPTSAAAADCKRAHAGVTDSAAAQAAVRQCRHFATYI